MGNLRKYFIQKSCSTQKYSKNKGFTLIELMICISILLIMIVFIAPFVIFEATKEQEKTPPPIEQPLEQQQQQSTQDSQQEKSL